MADHLKIAGAFFDACESGKGWAACAEYCTADAGFAAQADALADIKSLEAYAEWMKGLLSGPIPNGSYEITGFAYDAARNTVVASAVFRGTHSGDGGPIPATGKSTASDYVYVMRFEGDRIVHMTKVWNDTIALRELGWA